MPKRAPESEGVGSIEVLGVRFHALGREQAARAVAELVRSGGKSYVVKPYSEFMPRAARDAGVRDILNGAALCLADGVGILWAAHYLSLGGGRWRAFAQLPASLASLALNPGALRRPLPQAMAGVDFTWEMLSALAAEEASVFLLGGTRPQAHGALERIAGRFPRLRIAGARDGYFRQNGPENERVVAEINAARPQVLLVGMGFPRQERWIARNLPRLDVNVAVAEGGSFSFISGATARAPGWMRASGLEWLYRLVHQPARWRRQMAIPAFLWLVVRERLRRA